MLTTYRNLAQGWRGASVAVAGAKGERVSDDDLRSWAQREIGFMRMAAIELRRIAERAPEVADELRHIANQLEADAADLAQRFGDLHRP